MKLQYFKENFYKMTTAVAIIALIGIQAHGWVNAQDGDNRVKSSTEIVSSTDSEDEVGNLSPNLPNIPNATCLSNLSVWSGGSDTYNPNTPYNILFASGAPSGNGISPAYLRNFQDVNGDNLPDFINSTVTTIHNQDTYKLSNFGCVYLNNGNGWDKAFVCRSVTTTNIDTGEVIEQLYQGDCAGEPSSSQEN